MAISGPKEHTAVRKTAIRISALLLLFQSILLLLIVRVAWLRIGPHLDAFDVVPTAPVLDSLLLLIVFAPLAVLALPIGIGLYFLRPLAWILAMLLQAAMLGISLYFYFVLPESTITRGGVIYVIMTSCILMVLYLNSAEVRVPLGAPSATSQSSGRVVDG